MGIVVGIDVGGSTTKIVGLSGRQVLSPMCITATDPVASLFGAFGKYVYDNSIELSDVEQVMVTGVGSSLVDGAIFGLPTKMVDEFTADGLGAHFGSELQRLIVVSMGTGTSFVKVEGDDIRHIGGVSMGGGTLLGLSALLLHTTNLERLNQLAMEGNYENVNLQIRDICKTDIEGLPRFATASLFGKVKNADATDADLASGIACMVIQTIGSATILSALNTGIKDYVMIGNLSKHPLCRVIFDQLEELYGVRFHIPEHSEFRTAIGAALAYNKVR